MVKKLKNSKVGIGRDVMNVKIKAQKPAEFGAQAAKIRAFLVGI
jgi:hypothetical protein